MTISSSRYSIRYLEHAAFGVEAEWMLKRTAMVLRGTGGSTIYA